MCVCPFAVGGDVTPKPKPPCRQRAFQLPAAMSWWHDFCSLESQSSSVRESQAGLPTRAGHSLSFLRLLGGTEGWVGPGSPQPLCGRLRPSCGVLAGGQASVHVPQLNWTQLLPRSLRATHLFLGRPVLPTTGSLGPNPRPMAPQKRSSGGQWGGRC